MTASNELFQRYYGFPVDLTYDDFIGLDTATREAIVARNRVLQTDTYNRTMNHAKGPEWNKEETYTLQMRRAPRGYLVIDGVRRTLEKLFRLPITANEVTFAEEFYHNHARVRFFNRSMWETVLENQGTLPLEIDAVEDGTALLAGDPIMRVQGPGELAAHFEPDYHRIFYPSLVATDAHVIGERIGGHRFTEFGKRGANTEEMHMMAVNAMRAGGIDRTSNDAAVAAHPDELWDAGTIGHRFIQFADTEEAAFRRAVESLDAVSLLIDLTDSYRGIDFSCRLKQEYRSTGKKIWLRLDSGDLLAQALYALRKFRELGFVNQVLDKIVIEDLNTIEDMVRIDEALKKEGFDPDVFIVYGAGSLLTTHQKSRGDASTGFKLSAVEGKAKLKFSDSPGKESLPGEPTVIYRPEEGVLIAQVGEFPGAEAYLVPAFRPDKGLLLQDDIQAFRARLHRTFAHIAQRKGTNTPLSPRTKELAAELRKHYNVSGTHIKRGLGRGLIAD